MKERNLDFDLAHDQTACQCEQMRLDEDKKIVVE